MNKKTYIAPKLKTEEVNLGVFGNYKGDILPGGKNEPLRPVSDLDLRIE